MNPSSGSVGLAPLPVVEFAAEGFCVIEGILDVEQRTALAEELSCRFEERKKSNQTKIGGLRHLLQTSNLVAETAANPRLISILSQLAGADVFPVRAIFFDKTPDSNWGVPWHQDLAVCVREQIETPEFTGWSCKDGEIHVHPPAEVLDGMLTARLHLDDCDERNGALRVLPGSHQHGKLGSEAISELAAVREAVDCHVSSGGVLFMKPLLLHSSSRAMNAGHRRVLHLEYATKSLPNGLRWMGRQ